MAGIDRRTAILTGIGAVLAGPALAAKVASIKTTEVLSGYTVAINDLSPRFLDFYAAAQGLDPDARFAAWQERYGFAAVPPGPRGDAIARRLLDQAWPRYPDALGIIHAGAAGMRPRPLDVLVKVAALLRAAAPVTVKVVAYVGGFETNAFTAGDETGVTVAVPIEMDVGQRTLILPHEMTHAVHMLVGGLSRGYERSLGRVIFEEGLAMHAARHIAPGHDVYEYVGEKAWFDQGMARKREILTALAPVLDRNDYESVFKFTMGQGDTGMEREAYIAGWLVVGRLLNAGATLPQLARVPEGDIPAKVAEAIKGLLAQT